MAEGVITFVKESSTGVHGYVQDTAMGFDRNFSVFFDVRCLASTAQIAKGDSRDLFWTSTAASSRAAYCGRPLPDLAQLNLGLRGRRASVEQNYRGPHTFWN